MAVDGYTVFYQIFGRLIVYHNNLPIYSSEGRCFVASTRDVQLRGEVLYFLEMKQIVPERPQYSNNLLSLHLAPLLLNNQSELRFHETFIHIYFAESRSEVWTVSQEGVVGLCGTAVSMPALIYRVSLTRSLP